MGQNCPKLVTSDHPILLSQYHKSAKKGVSHTIAYAPHIYLISIICANIPIILAAVSEYRSGVRLDSLTIKLPILSLLITIVTTFAVAYILLLLTPNA